MNFLSSLFFHSNFTIFHVFFNKITSWPFNSLRYIYVQLCAFLVDTRKGLFSSFIFCTYAKLSHILNSIQCSDILYHCQSIQLVNAFNQMKMNRLIKIEWKICKNFGSRKKVIFFFVQSCPLPNSPIEFSKKEEERWIFHASNN